MRLRALITAAVVPAAAAASILVGGAAPAQAANGPFDRTLSATCKPGSWSPTNPSATLQVRVRGVDRGTFTDISSVDVRTVSRFTALDYLARGATHRGSSGIHTWSVGFVPDRTWKRVKGAHRVYDGSTFRNTARVDFASAPDGTCGVRYPTSWF